VKIYFTRHGESEANLIHEISNRGFRHPLTEKGRQMAFDLAETLQGIPFKTIYASPVTRATQTGQILGEILGIPVEITDALREYDCGIIEGRSDEVAWDTWKWLWAQWFEHGNLTAKIEGGETFLDVKARFVPLIDNLVNDYHDTDENFILVGHGGTYSIGLPLVLSNITPEFMGKHGGLPYTKTIIAEPRPEGLVCISWCGEPV
jgi:probable phosphoglycerate mutase